MKYLSMNTIWIIARIDRFEKRYVCFPMHDREEGDIIIDKWFLGYGE